MHNLLSTASRKAARGFTLIEIALVMVISGIAITYLIDTFLNIQKIERNESAVRQIETIKQAIVTYAANNKTAGREIYLRNNTNTRRVVMPAGRPYLPCPDITGDGIEDRVALPTPTNPLTLQTSATNQARTAYENANAERLKDYELWNPGSCLSSRGIVPWRTLGTPATDPWGNRYTYRVTPSFAGAAHGFDQNTSAINVGAVFPVNTTSVQITINAYDDGTIRPTVTGRFIIRPPIADPEGKYQSNVTSTLSGSNYVFIAPAIVCSQSPCPPTDPATYPGEIVAGDFSDEEITLNFPELVEYEGAGDIEVVFDNSNPRVQGLPFVVLSHGRNGHGAVRGNDNEYHCNRFPSAPSMTLTLALMDYNAERVNAVFSNSSNPNCSVIAAPGQNARNSALDYGFVAGINHGVRADSDFGYDDIVGWMSDDELSSQLSSLGVFPVGRLPLIVIGDAF